MRKPVINFWVSDRNLKAEAKVDYKLIKAELSRLQRELRRKIKLFPGYGFKI